MSNTSNAEIDAFNRGVELGKQHEILRNKKDVVDTEIDELQNCIVSLKIKSKNFTEQISVMIKEIAYCRNEIASDYNVVDESDVKSA